MYACTSPICPLQPHVLQPATLHDAGECGTGLRQHAAWAAHRRCARARQAHGSRPETSSRTRLHPSQDVPVFARTQSERNPAQARACSSRGFGESTWRRWRGRMPAWSKWPGSQQPMRHPTATEARPCPPACPGPRSPPPFGLQPGSPRGLDAEEGLWLRRSGAGPKSPVPPPLRWPSRYAEWFDVPAEPALEQEGWLALVCTRNNAAVSIGSQSAAAVE